MASFFFEKPISSEKELISPSAVANPTSGTRPVSSAVPYPGPLKDPATMHRQSTWIPLRQNIYVFLEENATKKHVPCSIQGGPMIAGTAYIALKRRAAGSMAIGN